jgi:CubicO group peptidase (beta-lactamase class C family)
MKVQIHNRFFTKSKFFPVVIMLFLLGILPAFFLAFDRLGPFEQEKEIVSGRTAEKLDLYLSRSVPFGFSGALLVEEGGEVVLNKGYGLAIRSENIPNTADTVFSVGSLTKQFTAAGIMRLEMIGKLNTEDRLDKYFENVPEDKKAITLHHLLTHTSGVVDAVGPDYQELEREDLVKKVFAEPLLHLPGEEFAYSNAGYSLLAAIIEKVSGHKYEEFLREQLWLPAGMEFTGYRLPDWGKKTVAHWYVGERDNGIPLDKPYPYWNLVGNGGVLSTTGDMLKWHHALLGHKILSPAVKKKMFTPYLNEYGYGWDVIRDERGLLIQHDGGSMLGNSAEMRRYIDKGITTILFCNQSYGRQGLMGVVRDKIETLVFGGEVAVAPEVRSMERAELEKYSGFYDLADSNRIEVKIIGNGLKVSPIGQEAINALFETGKEKGKLFHFYNNLTVNVMVPALSGDFEDFSRVMYDREHRLGPVRDLIEARLKQGKSRTGEINKVVSRATLPAFFRGQEAAQTFVELKGEKGSLFFTLYWRDKMNVGVAPAVVVPDLSVPFYWLNGQKFAGYHMDMARNFRISFETADDATVKSISIGSGEDRITAEKAAAK